MYRTVLSTFALTLSIGLLSLQGCDSKGLSEKDIEALVEERLQAKLEHLSLPSGESAPGDTVPAEKSPEEVEAPPAEPAAPVIPEQPEVENAPEPEEPAKPESEKTPELEEPARPEVEQEKKPTIVRAPVPATPAPRRPVAEPKAVDNDDGQIASPNLSNGALGKAVTSSRFIIAMEKVMSGFGPELAPLPDNRILECTPSIRMEKRKDYQRLGKAIRAEWDAAQEKNRETEKDFYTRISPIHQRIDFGWETRHGKRKIEKFSCYYSGDGWYNESRSQCRNDGGSWRVRSTSYNFDPSVNLYSNTSTPEMPYLMNQLSEASVTIPERLHCVVADVRTTQRKKEDPEHWVYCATGLRTPRWRIRLDTPNDTLNIGDLVSVPVRDQLIGDAVIYKIVESNGYRDDSYWMVDALAYQLKVEEARANCPDAKAISSEICRTADKKTPPESLIFHCLQGEGLDRLHAEITKLDRRSFSGKDGYMTSALVTLSQTVKDDPVVWELLGKYHTKLGHPAKALEAYQNALPLLARDKDLYKLGQLARKLEGMDLFKEATAKACSIGMKKACKALRKAYPNEVWEPGMPQQKSAGTTGEAETTDPMNSKIAVAMGGTGSEFVMGDGSGGMGFKGTGNSAGLSKKGKKKGKKTGILRVGSGTSQGFCKKIGLKNVVRRRLGAIRACYEKRLQVKPKLAGKATFRWTISDTGKVQSVKVTTSALKDSSVESCISRVIKRMRFPKPESGICVVQWPFVFTSG